MLAGCSTSSPSATNDAGDAGLADTFGDCGAATCEVALAAFTKTPGSIPYCPPSRASVDLSCPGGVVMSGATCADVFTVRTVYGFPGDFYECRYDVTSGALVGAKWAPDNHPTQFAGVQLPASCALADLCPDGGANDAAAD